MLDAAFFATYALCWSIVIPDAILAHMENQTDGVWIGLRREDSVATWKWSDNSPVVFTNWDQPNEPQGSVSSGRKFIMCSFIVKFAFQYSN